MEFLKRHTSALAMTLVFAGAGVLATQARAEASLVPEDAAWTFAMDFNRLMDSPLGQAIPEHAAVQGRDDFNQMLDSFSNMLGLDLRTDLGLVVAYGGGFTRNDVGLAFEIGNAETNIEGLLLAANGYKSYDYNGSIMHTAIPDGETDEQRFFCAVMPGEAGLVVLSPDQQRAEAMVDQAKAGARVQPTKPLQGEQFMRLSVNHLPGDLGKQAGRSHLVAMIQSFDLTGSTGEMTELILDLHLNDPQRARQFRQLIDGGLAMLEFAAAENPEAEALLDLSSFLTLEQPEGESRVTLNLRCDTEEIGMLLDSLYDLQQGR